MNAPFDINRAINDAEIVGDDRSFFANFALGWFSVTAPEEAAACLKSFVEDRAERKRAA